MNLDNFVSKTVYSARELGVEPGEYEYVTSTGEFRTREYYEEMADAKVNNTNSPMRIFGINLPPCEVAREMLYSEWDAFVDNLIARDITNDVIRKII